MPNQPTVLITGGAKRIGACLTRAFAAAGWHIIIHYGHSEAAAQALAQTLPSAETVHANLADPAAATEALKPHLARAHLLINSAAVFDYDDAHHLDPTTFAETLKVNAETPTRLAQILLASGENRTVIHLLDMKIANPNPDFFSYTMAKNALASTVVPLAMAHPKNRIYGLAPGAMLPSYDQHPAEHETSGRLNLLRRLTTPEELAQTALFLATAPLASGQTVFVDSGQHLLRQPRDVLFLARQEQG